MAINLLTGKRSGRDWSCSISGDDAAVVGNAETIRRTKKYGGVLALVGAGLYLASRSRNLVVDAMGKDKRSELQLAGKLTFLGGSAAFLLGELAMRRDKR